MASTALREASDAEIAAVFRPNADHIVGTMNGEAVVYVRFQTIEGRRWGMINMISAVAPSFVLPVFLALRKRLRQEREPVYALAQTQQSPRLLKLIGLKPTGEYSVGKEIWRWTPER